MVIQTGRGRTTMVTQTGRGRTTLVTQTGRGKNNNGNTDRKRKEQQW